MPTTNFSPDAHPETNTVDGETGYTGGADTWANVHGQSSGYAADNFDPIIGPRIQASTTTNLWSMIQRPILLFDIASLGTDTITAATLNLFVTGKGSGFSQDVDVVMSTPASDTALVAGDYSQLGTTVLGSLSVASFNNNQYNAITINATGITALATALAGDGIVRFGLRCSSDRANTEPTWVSGFAGGITFHDASHTNKPYLAITHLGDAEILPAEGRSAAASSARAVAGQLAQTQALSRSAERSQIGTRAVADTIAREVTNTGGVLALPTATLRLFGRSTPVSRDSAVNVTLAGAIGLSRDYATESLITFARAFQFARDTTAAYATAQPISAADLNARSISWDDSRGDPLIIVDGALEAIGYPRATTSSGAFGVLMTPLVARGGDRSTTRSTVSAPKSTAGPTGLSHNRERSGGSNKAFAQAEGGEVVNERTRGKIASQGPIEGSDYRTSTSGALASAVAKVTGARSYTLRHSLAAFRIMLGARGLSEPRSRDTETYVIIASALGTSISPARDGATITVAKAALNGRSITPERDGARITVPVANIIGREIAAASDRQLTLSACFVVSASVTSLGDRGGSSGVARPGAARSIASAFDSAGTRSAVFVNGRSSTPAAAAVPPLSASLAVGLSIAARRDSASPPLSFAAVVVQDRVTVESSGRMITSAKLFASEAVRSSSTLSTVNAIPGFIVGEPGMVVIN